MYEITEVATGKVMTGALGYMEAVRKLNEMNRTNRGAYTMGSYMPIKRESVQVESKKELPSMKAMVKAGIEFTSKVTEPGYLFVGFRTEQAAREIMESMNEEGFTVELCGNPSWIKVKQDY